MAVTLTAIMLTALLNCDELVRLAQRLPYGTERTAALRLADANRDVSHALGLAQPRGALDRLFGHAHETGQARPALPTTPTQQPAPPVTPSAPVTTPPPPSAAHPLRVYLGGDSVADQLGEAFQVLAGQRKVITVDDDARISSGLTRPDYFDWPARLQQVLVGRPPPQVMLVMFGANDVQPIMTTDGPASVGTPAWLAEYRSRVAATMTMLANSGVDVYWIGQPLMRSAYFTQRIDEVDAIYASEAAKHGSITFIDTRPLLADGNGHYADYLPNADGTRVLMRASDGVHLTRAGAQRLANHVLSVIGHRWDLPSP